MYSVVKNLKDLILKLSANTEINEQNNINKNEALSDVQMSCSKLCCVRNQVENECYKDKVNSQQIMINQLHNQLNALVDILKLLKINQQIEIDTPQRTQKPQVPPSTFEKRKVPRKDSKEPVLTTTADTRNLHNTSAKQNGNQNIKNIISNGNTKNSSPNQLNREEKSLKLNVSSNNQKTMKKSSPIKGKNEECSNLKIAERIGWIFLSGFDPQTKNVDVTNYIESKKAGNYECEEIITRNSARVKSFKLGVPLHIKTEIMTEDLWPSGIILNNFFNVRKKWSVE